MAGLCASAATPALASATAGYSHDSSIGLTETDWMRMLPDSARLSELSLPGTHDSGASVAGGDSALTQSMSLSTQLNSGIRAWDIRLADVVVAHALPVKKLGIYHGPFFQKTLFSFDASRYDYPPTVLQVADTFLQNHPSETLLMRIQDEQPTPGFADKVKTDLDADPHYYRGTSDNPALGEVRGKIVVLQNFSSPSRVGIPWRNDCRNPGYLCIQDDYHLTTNWNLADKWRSIKAQLDRAAAGSRNTVYVNFLSGSGGSFPYFVASGHSSPGTSAPNLLTGWTRGYAGTCFYAYNCLAEYPSVGCLTYWFFGTRTTCSVAFEGANVLTMQEMDRQKGRPHRYGLIYADFPGRGLISDVIAANLGAGLGAAMLPATGMGGTPALLGTALALCVIGAYLAFDPFARRRVTLRRTSATPARPRSRRTA
ncbi:hypothetical protein GCM10009839_69260 [Catenulispora yoronensis]|uniref:1-phosphatidylinositol phosphodiesterase n=1 Tax=Catenulispora yoronensis TaxID=450799 RepID=A0ABN2VB78_9ACTN